MWTNRLSKSGIGYAGLIILALAIGVTASAQTNTYQSQTANLGAVKIHYLKTGSGNKTLVFIHGFGDTSHMWIPLFDEFGKDYTIIAPDMRGLGESSRPATGYNKKTIAADIHELVKSLGYQKIDLVGHDIGLMVAYAYAAQYPGEVRKLALLEAPIPGIGDIWQKITRRRNASGIRNVQDF
jgi:pimeloyl-ACP methyl ester carboxylesterase